MKNLQYKGIIFFDCDETIRTSKSKDWIGSKISSFKKINNLTIERKVDKKQFTLKQDIFKLLIKLQENGYLLGIISDNLLDPVMECFKILGLDNYFLNNLIYVKLRKGYCPKDQMIEEVIQQNNIYIYPNKVRLVDDKNYQEVMSQKGYNFVLAEGNSLYENCKFLLS